MFGRKDKGEPESYREIVARRHRSRRWWRRFLGAVAAVAVVTGGAVVWLSQVMIAPPRPRLSESSRPTLGLVLRSAADGVRVAGAVAPARAAGLRPGDRIEAIDGDPVDSPADVERRVRRADAGEILRVLAHRPDPAGVVLADVTVEVRPVSPADLGLDYQDVLFTSPEGLALRAWYVPAPAAAGPVPAVAYGHGNAGDRRQWLDTAFEVHHAGFAQVLLDFGGRGESEGEVITLGAREAGDLRAALEFLAGRSEVDRSRRYLAGRSMGAAAALLAAADGAPARALVLDSPYADLTRLADETLSGLFPPAVALRPAVFRLAGWRAGYDPAAVRPVDAARTVDVPMLILHGTDDRVVPFAHSRDIADAAGPRARLVPLQGAGHNDRRDDAVIEEIVRFLRSH